jgi:F-type H+/Na+-transporting ATPase subunit beta
MSVIAEKSDDDADVGQVVAVHGAILDIRFAEARLPAIDEGVEIARDRGPPLIAEVEQHLDPRTVRAVALDSTAGLPRGVRARATRAAIRVPVGDAVLGRLLNAVGAPADRGPALPAETPRRPIHAAAPAMDASARPWRCSTPASR